MVEGMSIREASRVFTRLRGHSESIGQRTERDLDSLLPLPPMVYNASERPAGLFCSLSLVRYRTNDYSGPVPCIHRFVIIRNYVDEVVISCGC